MRLRPSDRGFSRKIFDILEVNGAMSRSAISTELKLIGTPATKKQVLTCLKNMRQRGWVEHLPSNSRKFDITSQLLKSQRDSQQELLNIGGRAQIAPNPPSPMVIPTKVVKTRYIEAQAPTIEPRAPLLIHIIGLILVTATITAIATAFALRNF